MGETHPRSTTFDLQANCDADWKATINSINTYRAVCRQVFSILATTQAAGAKIDTETCKVTPTKAAKKIIEAATGCTGKLRAYELRSYVLKELCPTWLSFVWDSCRRDVDIVWKSKDPEIAKATRGWLVLQGSRGLAQFNWRGIGFKAELPKLDKHRLTLKWDHAIGPITFKLGNMDKGRYWVWKNLVDGGAWKIGTLYLNENDGRLRATITHHRPETVSDVDPNRRALLEINPGSGLAMRLQGPDKLRTYDAIDLSDAVAFLKKHHARITELERRKEACGNPRRPWGHRKGWLKNRDLIRDAALNRSKQVAGINHAWSRRIAVRAAAWRCGVVELTGVADKLGGFPWKWGEFMDDLKYKLNQEGIELICE